MRAMVWHLRERLLSLWSNSACYVNSHLCRGTTWEEQRDYFQQAQASVPYW